MLPCVKCQCNDTIVAHIRKFSNCGIARKPDDDRVLPLCNRCHHRQHSIGEVTFWGGIEGVYKAIDWALKLYGARDDIFKAQRIVNEARKDLFL
jgi:hypothetical protein